MYPFPFPYESHFPKSCQQKPCKSFIENDIYLYTNGKVREDPHVNPGALDGLDFALDDFLGSRKLFGSDADTFAFDTKAPVAV